MQCEICSKEVDPKGYLEHLKNCNAELSRERALSVIYEQLDLQDQYDYDVVVNTTLIRICLERLVSESDELTGSLLEVWNNEYDERWDL